MSLHSTKNRRLEPWLGVVVPQAFAPARGAAWELRQRERLERARDLIDRQFASELDLDRMAREACLSRYHFLRSFKRCFGETPHRYLTRRRMGRAQALLRGGELSVTEVCWEVGFESLGSFSWRFSRLTGESPERYRRRFWQLGSLRSDGSRAVPWCFAFAFRPLLGSDLGGSSPIVDPA